MLLLFWLIAYALAGAFMFGTLIHKIDKPSELAFLVVAAAVWPLTLMATLGLFLTTKDLGGPRA